MGCLLSSSCATEQYTKKIPQKSSLLMLESINVPLVQLSKLSRDLFILFPGALAQDEYQSEIAKWSKNT